MLHYESLWEELQLKEPHNSLGAATGKQSLHMLSSGSLLPNLGVAYDIGNFSKPHTEVGIAAEYCYGKDTICIAGVSLLVL